MTNSSTPTPPAKATSTGMTTAAREHLLNFADDEHMLGARHTEWIGMGPFLEEDLAFCSIAQDELGHAISLYEFLTDNVDHFALLRSAQEYRSCDLAELECSDWQDALVRHWLYDRAEELRWEALVGSSNKRLGEIALRSQREESFHRSHAASFMARISASGHDESVTKVLDAISRLLPTAAGIWEPAPLEAEAIAEGFVTASSVELSERWRSLVQQDLDDWGFEAQWPEALSPSRLKRISNFDSFLASLQEVIIIDTETEW